MNWLDDEFRRAEKDLFSLPIWARPGGVLSPEETKLKEHILGVVEDLAGALLWYDRKEDDDLPRDAIETALDKGVLTKQDIVTAFAKSLWRGLGEKDTKDGM
jgi:hypothetical protein